MVSSTRNRTVVALPVPHAVGDADSFFQKIRDADCAERRR